MSDESESVRNFGEPAPGGDAQAVIDAAQLAVDPRQVEPGELYLVPIPARASMATVDLERYLPVPRRKRARVELHTADAFAAYVSAHHEDHATTLYGDLPSLMVTAVLNGHSDARNSETLKTGSGDTLATRSTGGPAGWGDHRAVLNLQVTPEWDAWVGITGRMQDQVTFAEFIEDHVADIADPTGADMLELATTFEAKSDANFKSAIRLDSGQRQLTYEETIAARAGAEGRMTVPELITLGLRPFDGCEPYSVKARLRFRVVSGTLKIGVVLDRPDIVLRSAFDDVLAMLADKAGFAPLRGTPPA